jgi:glycosyltransferase involved in cell wall biosynthesis
MPPTRVLFVNHVARISGAEESLLALVRHLDRDRFDPILACPPGPLAIRAADAGVRTVSLPVTAFRRTRNPLTLSTYAVAWVAGTNHLRKILRDLKPGIVHSNSPKAHVYAGGVARKAGVAAVWHARDLRPLPFPAGSLCRSTDRVIAVSEAVADFLAANGLSRPTVTCIHNGMDAEEWRGRVASRDVGAELGIPEGRRILLMAAQFAPWKRHEDALRAMPDILAGEPAAHLLLVGDDRFGDQPELSDRLEALAAELDIKAHVTFAGHRENVPDLMSAAEVVLIPSDAEPFGRVAIEAMALGKPVVGTRAGGLPEVVRDGETGLLVVPRFPESLAAACLRVLENSSLARRLGEAGKRRVSECFDIHQTVERVEALYESMLHPPLKWAPV